MDFYDAVLASPVKEGQEVPVWKAGIKLRDADRVQVRELQKQGYRDIKISLAERMPEDVFDLAGKTVSMEQIINDALAISNPKI